MSARASPERRVRQRLFHFVDQFARQRGEIVHEVERVLDLVRDSRGELAERGEFFRLHEPVLRRAKIVERLLKLAGARLHFFQEARILDRDHRLIGIGLRKLDLSIGEQPRRASRQCDRADDCAVALQRHAQQRAADGDGAQRRIIVGVELIVGDMHDIACQQHARACRAVPGPLRLAPQFLDEARFEIRIVMRPDIEGLSRCM